jgi:hypothetical protein
MPITDEELKRVRDLPLVDALKYLAERDFGFTSDDIIEINRLIRDKFDQGKYAFVPDKEQARLLLGTVPQFSPQLFQIEG